MQTTSIRGLPAAASLALALALVACTADKAEVDEDFSDLAGVDAKSDYFSSKLKLLGSLHDGDAPRVRYTSSPRFRGYAFTAAAGDQVDVWVRASAGDALAWITDGTFKVVAKNDDASADTYDAHLVTTLPASGTAAGTYYVIFRDYDLATHYFNVAFKLRAAGGGDAAWRGKAQDEVQRLVVDFTPLAQYAVDKATIPSAARARFDASAAVLETPWTYRIPVDRKPVYLVFATDGSGEGATVVADLVDGSNTWFAHGVGHAIWDGSPGLDWGHDVGDPTMCRCEQGAGHPATCRWQDGTSQPSNDITCE